MKKYARKSDADGKGMNHGYCFNQGEYYCQTEKQARRHVESLGLNWQEELKTIDTVDEWFYLTDWEEIDPDEYFDISGNVFRLCNECKKEVQIINSNYRCNYCGGEI